MLQLLQNLGDGATTLAAVPSPGPAPGRLLIRTHCSLVSAGTERMLVDFGKAGWLGKARQQPEKVRAVLNKVRSEGALATWRAIRSKLEQPIPLGYCQVGTVVDAGGAVGMSPGQRVISNGPHSEVVSVAHGLCAPVPDGVSDEAAAFTPLAAIAWEGIQLLAPARGDRVIVTGLGLIGQLAVRILVAQGCRVLGFDPASERRELAARHGAELPPASVDPVAAAMAWSEGAGVAGVLITASAASNEIVSQAARSCRYRGKVVLVGVVGLALNRADFYRHEVSFQVSCSYGRRSPQLPGSAQANFRAILGWMVEGRLAVADLITHRFDFGAAASAYAALSDRRALGLLLSYGKSGGSGDGEPDSSSALLARSVRFPTRPTDPRASMVAVVGAGNFAFRTLLPALAGQTPPPTLVAIVSSQGAPAFLAARKFGASCASTDEAAAFDDPAVEAVFLTTRHDAHAAQAVAALQAGKHVWVEKPLALREEELVELETAARKAGKVLFVGFNRRFAPMAVALRNALRQRPGPYRFVMTVNAGRLDPDHWTLDPAIGGGRIVGEACHFVDLMRSFAGAPIADVRCVRRDTDGQDGGAFELTFNNGCTGLIDYRTDLPSYQPKERIEATGPKGISAEILNWGRLRSTGLDGLKAGGWGSSVPRKGHPEAGKAFLAGIERGVSPVPLEEILEVSRWSIAMQGMKLGAAETREHPVAHLADRE